MKPNIFISTPLEEDQVNRIREAAGARADVTHHPDLMPPVRYTADHKGVDGFERTGEAWDRWCAALEAADFLWDIPPLGMLPNGDLSSASRLKWVQTTSSGVQPLVRKLGLHEAGVVVTTAKGVHRAPLSEFVLMALLMHFRGLDHLRREQKAKRWERYCGDGLEGKRVAIIGFGEVGRRVSELLIAMGVRVIATSRSLTADEGKRAGLEAVFDRADMAEALSDADAVVLCVPQSPETDNMIDADVIARMKPGMALVNIARGSVIDEQAMARALGEGQIGFAALDVAAVEPLPPESPLWDLPNVLISPHSASTVTAENSRITDIFIHNLTCMLDGRQGDLINALDPAKS